jgi:hypothetical protein
VRKCFSIASRVAYSANMFLKIKTICLHDVIPEMHSFSMRPAKYFYGKPLPKYLNPKTVLIYHPHSVQGADDKLGQFLDQDIEATASHRIFLRHSLKSCSSLVSPNVNKPLISSEMSR